MCREILCPLINFVDCFTCLIQSQKEEARNTVKANREESIMKSIACTSSSTLEVKSTKEVKVCIRYKCVLQIF